jgi:hypothetical protein
MMTTTIEASTHDTPTLLDLPPPVTACQTQTEASIAELLLGGTPPDNFKISNHETIQRPYQYKHYSLNAQSQDSFAQMFADAERK